MYSARGVIRRTELGVRHPTDLMNMEPVAFLLAPEQIYSPGAFYATEEEMFPLTNHSAPRGCSLN